MSFAPICCGQPARLTAGTEVYPHRRDLADRPIWKCDGCGAYVGCHRGTTAALGTPAGRELRFRRGQVHKVLDPIWQTADLCPAYAGIPDKVRRGVRNKARDRVYAWLADRMGLTEDTCHVGMFDLGQCRVALDVLRGVTFAEIRTWARAREGAERREVVA